MSTLENRVPPPLVATLIGALMWGVSSQLPRLDVSLGLRLTATLAVLLLGITICLAGVWSFHQARTTVNPLQPERASALVDGGIYQYTRNPMYLGFAIILGAWSISLASPVALLGVVGFVLYMNRFQIAPEERALGTLFGEDFARYKLQVRRWI